jgi:outer membrane cobalamin receptor
MVITATRTNRLISQTPASVGVISQEEIEISPAKNMDDLIMKETGVQVRRVVGIGEGVPSDIIIRGIPGSFGSSRTLILVDGIPTNVSGTPFLILNEIPLTYNPMDDNYYIN